MKRALLCAALLLFGLSVVLGAGAEASRVGRLNRISDAITEIDIGRAERLFALGEADSRAYMFERARLLVYRGECDAAATLLSNPVLSETREGASLGELAKSCAGATVAGVVLEDKPRGLWIRLQDDADRALVPLIFDVAAKARDAIGRDLGVDMPRPLRIDLVRDLFSLSAVSGLPREAAETTGTLGVARWGRVILLSPRATTEGYHWEDTLAHEITHLLVTRATRDHAPLWLQEGIAKREEARWRERRPFDDPEWAEMVARAALRDGRSIGLDKLGPSIAMLPTPEAAMTAFAEVTSFVRYFVEQTGDAGLKMLFSDLRGIGGEGADAALRSVTGHDLGVWNQRWQRALAAEQRPLPQAHEPEKAAAVPRGRRDPREIARRVRLTDLLLGRGHVEAAATEIGPAAAQTPRDPTIRHRAALAQLALGDRAGASESLGTETEFGSVHGPWFSLRGRLEREAGERAAAEGSFRLGIALAPLSEDVACEGHRTLKSGQHGPLPEDAVRRELCAAVRAAPRD